MKYYGFNRPERELRLAYAAYERIAALYPGELQVQRNIMAEGRSYQALDLLAAAWYSPAGTMTVAERMELRDLIQTRWGSKFGVYVEDIIDVDGQWREDMGYEEGE